MSHTEMGLRSLTKSIMSLMNRIEDRHGLMFHEIDADLEKRIFETIDGKNKAKLMQLVSELEAIESK